jgi:HK97 gp10 family phage protein
MRVNGLNNLRIELKKIDSKSQSEVVKALNITAVDVQRAATKFAPVNKKVGKGGSPLKNSNKYEPATKNRKVFSVFNTAHYSPYQEFGTGSKVRVPQGYQDVAIKHKGSGKRQVNISPQPFLIPAIELNIPKLMDRLRKIFK